MSEGLARELVNRIQNLRKDTGLDVSDRITLTLKADSDLVPSSLSWSLLDSLAANRFGFFLHAAVFFGQGALAEQSLENWLFRVWNDETTGPNPWPWR